jgi:hypothetical protein
MLRRVIWLQNPSIFWLCGRTICLIYLGYMGLVIFGRDKYVQYRKSCLSWVPLRFDGYWKCKRSHHQVLIKFQQHWLWQGCTTIRCQVHKFIYSIWNKNELLEERRSQSLCPFIRRLVKHIVVHVEAYPFCQLLTKFHPTSCYQG